MNDEQFMSQFTQRLNLEPPPKWVGLKRKRELPWLEIGWAMIAALMLGLHWAELRFGLFSLHSAVLAQINQISVYWLYLGLAAAYGLSIWLVPRLKEQF